eukprot:TRINITY_DN29176_c0_g1_i1.p1 TRINITY_DN29176_c0_g1~~TRINITY_DN29176_c0_g1_i1.p1  ORF type:complete len:3801 (-),score=763.37 TRINITY_DN29176_c0_g1_i1:725-11332(-)
MADGLSIILFEAVKGIQHSFHSHARSLLRPLLEEQAQGRGWEAYSQAARAAQLWAIKASLLRMRNHAGSLDAAADIVEAIFHHFRQATLRYARAAAVASIGRSGNGLLARDGDRVGNPQVHETEKNSTKNEGADKEQNKEVDDVPDDVQGKSRAANSQKGMELLNQEVLFYIDLLVAWLTCKPKPRNVQGESWEAFAEAAFGCFATLLEAGNIHGARAASEDKLLQFPPTALSVSEAVQRAAALFWRSLSQVASSLCTPALTLLLAGPSSQTEQATALSQGRDDWLNFVAAALLPELLPGAERTPLLPALAAGAAAAVTGPMAVESSPSANFSPEFRMAAAQLCSQLLRDTGTSSLKALAVGGGGSELHSCLLRTMECLPDAQSSVPPHDAAAAANCLLQLCWAGQAGADSCFRAILPPDDAASRLACVLPLVGSARRPEVQEHYSLFMSRILSSAVLVAVASNGEAVLPRNAWPASCLEDNRNNTGTSNLATWAAWALAWALEPPLRAPVLAAGKDSLLLLSQALTSASGPGILPLGRPLSWAMTRCLRAAATADCHIRSGVLQVALLFPVKEVLKCLASPVAASASLWQPDLPTKDNDVLDWNVSKAESLSQSASSHEQEAKKLLDLCAELEGTAASFEAERTKAELIRKIGRSVRKLPAGSWVGLLAVKILLSQLSVRLSTIWNPTEESLLYVASELTIEEETPTAALTAVLLGSGREKKRRKRSTKACEAEPETTDAADTQIELEIPNSVPAPETQSRSGPSSKKVGKKRRQASLVTEEDEDTAVGLDDGYEELDLEPWLQRIRPEDSSMPAWADMPAAWWWTEALWHAVVAMIKSHETLSLSPETNSEDSLAEHAVQHQRRRGRPELAQKMKRRDPWQVATDALLEAANSELWRGGPQTWRHALEEVWSELESWQPTSVAGVTLHELAWRLASKLLQQQFWARPASLLTWQQVLGRRHSEWLLAKFLQHLRAHYGQGRGRSPPGLRIAMVHALQCITEMPSIEVCAKPLVKLCIHGCLHWLLLEPDSKLQQHAIVVLAKCRRSFPFMMQCEASLRRLCDESTFSQELLSLSVTRPGEELADEGSQASDGSGGGGSALYKHREALMPIVLRILFSKATKKGRQLDKRTSQTSRRASVFSYLSALTEDSGMPELLFVLLESVMLVLAPGKSQEQSAGMHGKHVAVTSSIHRAILLRRTFMQRSGNEFPPASWLGLEETAAVLENNAEAVVAPHASNTNFGRHGVSSEAPAPLGWTWPIGQRLQAEHQEEPVYTVVLDPCSSPQRLLGLLQSLADVIPQMALKLTPRAGFLMEVVASIIARVGTATENLQRHEQAQVTRQILRAALLRARDLQERFLELAPQLIAALKPAASTLEFLFARLASTSGAVQTSAVALLAQSWASEPALFDCFEKLCPQALPSLFRVPAAPAVRALIAGGERQVGGVVPIVAEIALRLCKGSILDAKAVKKVRRQYRDVKREMKRRKRLEGDGQSDDEDTDDEDGDHLGDLSKADHDTFVARGVELLRPHVDVLLSSLHELIENRLRYKANVSVSLRGQTAKGNSKHLAKDRKLQVGAPTLVTANELGVLSSVAEWCSDAAVARRLVQLLMTVLSSLLKERKTSVDNCLLIVASLRRLMFVALPSAGVPKKPEELEDSLNPASQAAFVVTALGRFLGHAKDVALRAQLAEFLVEVEALRAFGAQAKTYLQEVAELPASSRWKPADNFAFKTRQSNVTGFMPIHVAHLTSALNTLRRSGLREPDADAHVEVLQTLADHHLLSGDSEAVPASLLQPLLAHGLFVLGLEGVDLGVQRGMERVLYCLADRLLRQVSASDDHLEDSAQLLHLVMTSVMQALRRMLKSQVEEVFRTALRVQSHFVRTLAPHCAVLKSWQQPHKASMDAVAAFGSSPEALLLQDLLPLIRARDTKGDDGGDLFANLLHLQKHRRGRGLLSLQLAAEAGKLTSTTLSNFVVPLSLQAVIQHSASSAAFDPNYAEVGVKCLGECMRHGVSWSTCLQTVRFLSLQLSKQDQRERWLVRAACECLTRFPLPAQDLPSPAVLDGFQSGGKSVEQLDASAPVMPSRRSAKGKGRGKGKGKGKGRRKGRGAGNEKPNKNHKEDTEMTEADAAEEERQADDTEMPKSRDAKDGNGSEKSVAKSLRNTVLPILQKMVWQSEPVKTSKGAGKKGSSGAKKLGGGGLVRIAVIGVMMHCLRHLTTDDFTSELPKILSYVVQGLRERDADNRRASRQALQQVATSLGPEWLAWLVRELRARLDRGFMLPVCASAVLAAVQAMAAPDALRPLRPGDLDEALQELLAEAARELDRQMDASRQEAEMEEEATRRGQVPEAKKPKGPDLMLLAGQFSSPRRVLELVWALDRRLQGERPRIYDSKSKITLDPLPQTMMHLRRIEELMTRAMSGLCLNSAFATDLQVEFSGEILTAVVEMLADKGKWVASTSTSTEQETKDQGLATSENGSSFLLQPAKSREEAFKVQEGAATGRAGGRSGTKSHAKGALDAQARAGALGVLGLRLLRHALQSKTKPDVSHVMASPMAQRLEEVLVPATVRCFCSRQDRLFVASAKCLAMLRGFFASRPEILGAHGAEIARTVLKTFETVAGAPVLSQHLRAKAKLRGLQQAGAEAVLATCTRLLSSLLNNRQSAEWFKSLGEETMPSSAKAQEEGTKILRKGGTDLRKFDLDKKKRAATTLEKSTFFDALVLHIQNALEAPTMQPAVLQLLRRVLLRNRVLSAAVYQCVDTVGEVMIAGSDKRIAQQCAQIFVDFMLDYPHEAKALELRMSHLLKNLGYAEEGGRRAVLNCLYLVVLHFPETELSTKWGGLIFVSAAARLPQEPDPTAHRMLHVLIRTLLTRVNPSSRDKLLQLALPWGKSAKRALHAALAESLGLFAESSSAGPSGTTASGHFVRVAIQALAKVLNNAESPPEEVSTGTQTWQLAYSACRGFERLLSSVPPLMTVSLLKESSVSSTSTATVAELSVNMPRKTCKRAGVCGYDPPSSTTQQDTGLVAETPGNALQYLWRFLLAGPKVLTDQDRHPWLIAVALRVLESQALQWLSQPDLALQWLESPVDASGARQVTAHGLLGALEGLLSSDRLEEDSTLAPLAVKALRPLISLLLHHPELVAKPLTQELDDDEEADVGEEEPESVGLDDQRSEECSQDEEQGVVTQTKHQKSSEASQQLVFDEEVLGNLGAFDNCDGEMKTELNKSEDHLKQPALIHVAAKHAAVGQETPAEDKGKADDANADEMKVPNGPLDAEDDMEAALDEAMAMEKEESEEALEDGRKAGPSLFEAVQGHKDNLEAESKTSSAASAKLEHMSTPEATAETLRDSRIRWLVVRLSQKSRAFLAAPSQHFVRLVSILRLFSTLVDHLPMEVMAQLLGPILSPAYRCSTAFGSSAGSNLPEVQTLAQALELNLMQRGEFLAQLGQSCIDAICEKMKDAGRSSDFAGALAAVRKAVEKGRQQRTQKRKLQPATDPHAAAVARRTKNRRKAEGKKRKMEELILNTKGGRGKQKVKQSRTLV